MARVCVAGVRPYHLVDGALHEAVEAAGAVLAIGQQAPACVQPAQPLLVEDENERAPP